MALVLVSLGAFVYLRVGDDLLNAVDLGLRSRAQVLVDAVAGQQATLVASEGDLIDVDEAFAQVLDRTNAIIEAASGVSDVPLLAPEAARTLTGPAFTTRQLPGFDDPVRLLAVPADAPASRLVVVGATLGDRNDALERLLVAMVTVGPAALVVTTGAGWLLAGSALWPVERMRREAAAISASDPARRLATPDTGDELARLASTLNTLLDRLQQALERERRFVDDASHELRSPLATLRAEIDLALARERTRSELQAAMRSASEDVGALQRLADDLLVLARMRGGRVPVRPVEIPIRELLARSVKPVAERARAAGVTLTVGSSDGPVRVDPDRVQQALRNLIENAVQHTPPGGRIQITGTSTDGTVSFVVADSGPGFPEDLLERAFEPFAGGPVRGTDHHSTGLGLAIVHAIAESHGGSVDAENDADGARVTLRLRA